MSYQSADEAKTEYVRLMGPVGEQFAELMQDAARLHLKWNEFLSLYGGPRSRIDDLNKSAPGFFFLTQNAWWNDIIMHIFRMTDHNPQVLSVPKLKVPLEIADAFSDKVTALNAAAKFAHVLRHNYIGHRNRDVALEVSPIPPASVADVHGAIAAIDDALQLVRHHFTGALPTMYEHLDILGGSEVLLWTVRRGLKARDEDIENFRPFPRFDD
jgi:HEPN superfamily AbiU2-like protein